jgi:hypothetical protein
VAPTPTKSAAVVAIVLAAALALAGCGGGSSSSSTVTPTAYARSLCQAVAPFEKDIANRASVLDPSKIKNAAQGKAALVAFLSALATDTNGAAGRLSHAGAPNVTKGKAIAGAFTSLFSRLDTTLHAAAQQAQALPTNSPAAFKTGATALGRSVQTSMGALGSSLAALKSPALETAAKHVTACQSLG